MAPQQSAQLVAFMSLNHESLLTTPDDVADVAMVKLRHLSRTQVQAPIPGRNKLLLLQKYQILILCCLSAVNVPSSSGFVISLNIGYF